MELDLAESVKKRELQDKANAEEMHLQTMEKLGESKKRREATGATATGQMQKKARRSGSETLEFMREKLETDIKMKQEEREKGDLSSRKLQNNKIVCCNRCNCNSRCNVSRCTTW